MKHLDQLNEQNFFTLQIVDQTFNNEEENNSLSTGESSGRRYSDDHFEERKSFMDNLIIKDKELNTKNSRHYLIWELVSASQIEEYKEGFHFEIEGLSTLSAYLYFVVGQGPS